MLLAINLCFQRNWTAPYENVFRVYANSKCLDQPAHLHSLIRAFIVWQQNHWILQNEKQRPKRYFVHGRDDLILHILHMFEDTFCLTRPNLFLYVFFCRSYALVMYLVQNSCFFQHRASFIFEIFSETMVLIASKLPAKLLIFKNSW